MRHILKEIIRFTTYLYFVLISTSCLNSVFIGRDEPFDSLSNGTYVNACVKLWGSVWK